MPLTTKPKRSTKIHDKRRSGSHHKRNEHYLKTYWPYLPLLLVVILGLTLNSFWSTAHKGVLGYATDMSAGELLQDTNQQRTGNSLGTLSLNNELDQAAQAKANDMVAQDYWSHNNPEGKTPWQFIQDAGYSYQTAGENLAYGFDTSSDTVTAWMNSPEHRANILNTTYVDVGFGIANSENFQGSGPETIVVAEYASPEIAAPASTPSSTPAAPASTASTPPSQTPAPASTPASTPSPTASPAQAAPTDTATSTPSSSEKTATTSPVKAATPQSISRIQLLSSSHTASWSAFAVSTIATISIAIFLLRHGLMWHRYLKKGERFIMQHKLLDLFLVAVGVLGIVLTQTAGVIR